MEPTFIEGAGGVPLATWELPGLSGAARTAPDRPPLLVAHATGFHSRCYRGLAAGLGDVYRVVAFDCRGHGHSGTPPLAADEQGRVPTMGWDTFAEDALAVVDALGLEQPRAFGHSSGGALLLLAEERRPGTFASIYTYEPIVAPPEVWAGRGAGSDPAPAARRRRPVFDSKAAALEHFSSKPPLSSLRGDVMVDYVEGGFVIRPDGAVALRCDPETEAATYAMAAHNTAWERLPQLGCPVTVGCGGSRGEFGRDAATALAARIPGGRIDEHPDLGHLGPFEDPDEVAQAVLATVAT